MMICDFTPFLATYSGPRPLLENHLGLCESCQLALELLTRAGPSPLKRRSDCPELERLVTYAYGAADRETAQEVSLHLGACASCLRTVQRKVAECLDESEVEETLGRATRVLEAHALARDLATWLSTEIYPREQEAVRSEFDDVYDTYVAAFEQGHALNADAEQAREPVGLAFAGTEGVSMAQRISMICTLAGFLRLSSSQEPSAVADAIEAQSADLNAGGFGERLIQETLSHLRAQESPDP